MTSSPFLMTCVAVGLLLGSTGCRSARSNDKELDVLLDTVSYDTTVPSVSPSAPAVATGQAAPSDSGFDLAEKAGAVRQAVGKGLKTVTGVLLFGVIKIVEGIFDFDDDDDDDHSPRGRADQNFNQWLDDRDRWRRGD